MKFGGSRASNVHKHPSLEPASRGDTLIATNVGFDGNAVALWAKGASIDALHGQYVSSAGLFPDVHVDRPVEVRVTAQNRDGDVLARTEIAEFRFAHPHIAAMPGGQWLLAGSRCSWTPERVDPNAAVYSSMGEALRYGILGDGLEQVRTTAAGDVWVGYFDEGIFGNYGWGGPGPEPIGSRGLVRFNQHLEQAWTYPGNADYGIYDEPTINIDGDEVWTTFDLDYPVAHIADGNVEAWANQTGAAHAVLVDSQRRVALVGEHVTVGELRDGLFRPTATATLALPAGTPATPTRIFALGPTLHAFGPDGAWWTTDIDALTGAPS